MGNTFKIKKVCGSCGGDSIAEIRTYPEVGGQPEAPSVIEEIPCPECTDGKVVVYTIKIAQLDDILESLSDMADKVDDVMDKCNDIKEVVDEL